MLYIDPTKQSLDIFWLHSIVLSGVNFKNDLDMNKPQCRI